jgi:hypothetical protein
MNTQNFEEKLKQMTKPEVDHLKHEDMLGNAIANAKDKSVVSWWWLAIPLYIIAMLWMKSVYMPETSLISGIHDFTSKQKFISVTLFLVLPVIFMIANFLSLRKIYFLSGSPKTVNFIGRVWFNVLMIFLCLFLLIIYSLQIISK